MRPRSLAAVLAAGVGWLGAVQHDASAQSSVATREAAQIYGRYFPAQAAQAVSDPLASIPVTEYVNQHVARVTHDGRSRLLLSATPLRVEGSDGVLRPVDLDLRDLGSWRAPARSGQYVRLGESASQGLLLGPDSGHAVHVVPLDRQDGEPVTLDSGQLLLAGTADATDTIMKPVPGGVETFDQLHGSDAPERFRYRLRGPADASTTLDPGGSVTMTVDGRLLLFVAPPIATDAAGRDVQARYTLDGDVLTLHVSHREASTTYPVLADPLWLSTYQYQSATPSGLEGWGVNYNPDDPSTPDDDDDWYYAFGTSDPGALGHPEASGLWIIPRGGKQYSYTPFDESHGPGAIIYWGAPGASTITGVTFTGFRYRHYQHPDGRGDGQAARLAVYPPPPGAPTWIEDFYGEPGERNDVTVQTPRPLPAGGKSITFWLYTADCGTGAICRWQVPSSTMASWAMVGGVIIELDDPAPPAAALSGPLTDRGPQWVNRTTASLDVRHEASDSEGGLAEVRLEFQLRGQGGSSAAAGVHQPSCDTDHHTPGRISAICQQSLGQTLTFDPQSLPAAFGGWIDFRAYARDYANNETRSPVSTIWVDREPPDALLDGDVWQRRGEWLHESTGHSLSISGEDRPAGAFSGVRRYKVDHGLQPSQEQAEQPLTSLDDFDACPSAQPVVVPPADWHPCPRVGPRRTFPIDLPEGRNRFVTDLSDFAVNTTSDGDTGHRDFDVYVDQTQPSLALSGSLADANGSWMARPDDSLDLIVDTNDNLSGTDEVTATIETSEGAVQPLIDEDLCPAPQPGFSPCTKSTQRLEGSVAGPELTSGDTRVEVRAHDYAGNARARTLRLHLDAMKPTVEVRGDLLDMQGELAAPTDPVSVIVDASDDYSGIVAIDLYLRDAQGGERLLRHEDTCSASPTYTGAGSPCPLSVVRPFEIKPGEIGEGRAWLIARATEFTGKTDFDTVDADLDLTAPAAPVGLVVRTDPSTDQSTVTFQPGPEPPGGAGVDHYVITVVVNGVVVSENISQYPYAALGGIPPGVDPKVLVRAVDTFDRESEEATAALAAQELEDLTVSPDEDDLELGENDDPSVAQDNPNLGVLRPEDFTDGGPNEVSDERAAVLRNTRRLVRRAGVRVIKRRHIGGVRGKPAVLPLIIFGVVVEGEAALTALGLTVATVSAAKVGQEVIENPPRIGGSLFPELPWVSKPEAGDTVPLARRATEFAPAGLLTFASVQAIELRARSYENAARKRREQTRSCWSNPAYARKMALGWAAMAYGEPRANSKLATRVRRALRATRGPGAVAATSYMDAHHIVPKVGWATNFDLLAPVKCAVMSLGVMPNQFINGVMLPGGTWVSRNPARAIPRTDHRAISHPVGEKSYAGCLRLMFGGAKTVAGMAARLILTASRLESGRLVRASYSRRVGKPPVVRVRPYDLNSCLFVGRE